MVNGVFHLEGMALNLGTESEDQNWSVQKKINIAILGSRDFSPHRKFKKTDTSL